MREKRGDIMKLKMSKMKAALFILAIMLTNIPIMADAVIIPISYNLYEAFPGYTNVVNFIVSGPQLIIAIASLIAAPLMMKYSKKKILIVSGIVCALGLVFGVVLNNVWYVLACRLIAGFATGFINVAAVALIAEVFIDEARRSYMMGIYNAVMAGIGTLMSVLAGILAVNGWTNAYKVFWSCIPMVLCFIFFLPEIQPEAGESGNTESRADKKGLSAEFWVTMFNLFLFYLVNMGFSYFVSIYVAENSLGNEAFAGTVASLSTVGSFICCLAFGFLYNRLGRKFVFIPFAVFLIAAILVFTVHTQISVCVGSFLIGGSYGSAFSYSYAHGPSLADPSQSDLAISIATFIYAIGVFLATYLETFLMGVSGGSFTSSLKYTVIIAVIVLAIEAVSAAVFRRKTN